MSTSFIGQNNLSRGVRNNNPGNIRPNPAFKWAGEIGQEGGYVIFIDVEHGIRAMRKDLTNKIVKDHLNTLDLYISKYAPPEDGNDTQAYINKVSQLTGFIHNQPLTADKLTLFKLVKAHIQVEDGKDYKLITDKMIQDGIDLM